ncbi:MAG: UDP-N-acetylglucosamine 2-epimerase (hydrolyzing) [Parcubacteria group bacterium CG11_big_fil_rev_8_21_14_0_20_39_22]|nr:MAG: UDP-N-acetylglucosamine 2-epimerase (hydrolyzing) [Parcubacteria group bacterium CG11_big_fil_rev_8_21_14_0_20_39_22]
MSVKTKKRRVCFVITSFIHYSRGFLILDELNKRKDIELYVAVAGTALLSKYSSKRAHIRELLEADGINNIHEVHFNLEGDSHFIKAKTAGLGIMEFTNLFNNIKPDAIVLRGDRFEVLSAAISASYLHIPIAHIEGGDVTGTIDESVRHSITKLSHIHFTTNEPARKRVLKMGEDDKFVFNFGSPDIEVVKKVADSSSKFNFLSTGSGADIDINKPYIMVMYHPVTSESDKMGEYTRDLLEVINDLNIQTFWFWPNFDSGSESISYELRYFNDEVRGHKIRFMRYLPPKDFIYMLKNSMCLVGNSSAGLKECSFLGVPVVNIGTRQGRRLRDKNVVNTSYEKESLRKAIKKQINKGKYPESDLYNSEDTAKNIANTLATLSLYVQKNFKG